MNRLLLALVALAALAATGCFSVQRSAPKPGITHVGSKPVVIPGHLIGNVLVVEEKGDKFGPYHFIVDTGSSVTLVSPDLAKRYASRELPPPAFCRLSGGFLSCRLRTPTVTDAALLTCQTDCQSSV